MQLRWSKNQVSFYPKMALEILIFAKTGSERANNESYYSFHGCPRLSNKPSRTFELHDMS